MELWYFNSNDKWSQVATQVSSLLQCSEAQVKKNMLNLANSCDYDSQCCLSLVQQLAARLHESEKLAAVLAQENKTLSNMLAKQQEELVIARNNVQQQASSSTPNNKAQYDIFSRRNILQHCIVSTDEDNGSVNDSPLSTASTASSAAYFENVDDGDFSDCSESDNCSVAGEDNINSCTEYNNITCDEDLVTPIAAEPEDANFDIATEQTCDNYKEDGETEEDEEDVTPSFEDAYYESYETTNPTKGKKKNVRFIDNASTNEQELLRKRKQKQASKLLRCAINR